MFPRCLCYAHRSCVALVLGAALLSVATIGARAQSSGDESDPLEIFKRGQDAHSQNNLAGAIALYDQALALHPEFPEAEFQKGVALAALERTAEAEKSLRRAAELRADWALPPTMLGTLLARANRPREAEPLLRRAIELQAANRLALVTLADLRLRAKAPGEAAALLKQVTGLADAQPADWVARAVAERAAGDAAAAQNSVSRALELNPQSLAARLERAGLRADAKDFRGAIEDIEIARRAAPSSTEATIAAAKIYAQADQPEKALEVLNTLSAEAQQTPEAVALRGALAGDENISPEAIAELEKRAAAEPREAALLARLGDIYRARDPQRALEYYRRALAVAPGEMNYATGYASALVQARRFAEAAALLKQIVARRPDDYTAHANLATALYELKSFEEAIIEFKWVAVARPEVAATHFFLATAYDRLMRFEEALGAYQTFLAQADANQNKLEIEKVNLRLPSLRNQIKRGEGVKRKK